MLKKDILETVINMKSERPIGVFDSGLGGISEAVSIHQLLPQENLIYFGDSLHNPYGTKTVQEITDRCLEICDAFMAQNVKAIVIACNTATSACVPLLRRKYPVDIIGMEPALKVAAEKEGVRRIAVWATNLTLREEKFAHLMGRFEQNHEIIKVACPKLVRLVEDDRLDDQEAVDEALQEYLEQSGNPQAIVLGCTHFLFFRRKLEELTGGRIRIVDGNSGTARHLRDLLDEKGLLNDSGNTGTVLFENSIEEKRDQSRRLFEAMEDL